MKRFYEVASVFYEVKDRVVSEEEVLECIGRLKRNPVLKLISSMRERYLNKS